MALENVVASLVLDVINHDQKQATVKTIALDSKTRYVRATITRDGLDYPVDENATVTLTILRPDNVGVQITGSVVDVDNADRTGTIKGVYAELTQAALAKSGTLRAQFKMTVGQQILRTEIFQVKNGIALDGETSEWADQYEGYNLDELVQSVNEMETDVSELKSGLSDITGLESLTYQFGYVNCNATTIDVTHINTSTGYKYAVDECSEGDAYIVNGTGALSAKSWCFVDANKNRLTYQPDTQTICKSERVIAPANAAYFVTNYRISMSADPYAIKETSGIISDRADLFGNHRFANRIEDNTDLNSVVNVGNYYVPSLASAQTMFNMPIEVGGRLTVITLSQDTAYMQMYSASSGRRFWRVYSSGQWMAWKEIVDKASVDEDIANRVYLIGNHNYANKIADNTDFDNIRIGNYYVASVSSAQTMINIPVKMGGRLTVITLSQDTAYMQIYSTTAGRRFWRVYSSGAWKAWQEIADKATVEEDVALGNAQEKGAYNAIQALILQATYNIAFANAFSPIRFKNHLGNIQNVHPKVLYIASGFGGHNYWMAYTPYPNSNDAVENPCVAYSDDGYNWTNISGNPLDNPNGNGYNSDTHLVYREDTGTLECWYRYVGPATQDPREETIYRQTTNDGVTWSAKELLYSNTSGTYAKLLSPSVIVENGKYCIWTVYSGRIDYYEAPLANPTQWTFVRSIRFTITDNGISVSPWHIDVIKDGDAYVMLLACRNGTSITNNVCSLFIATSTDNTSYSNPVKVVGGADNWDKYMYRSSIVKIGNKYRIYYSATKGGTTSIYNNAIWGIGITESNELTSGYIGKYV